MPESTQKEVVPSLHRWLKCAGKQGKYQTNFDPRIKQKTKAKAIRLVVT
jgi:hypothetical protein